MKKLLIVSVVFLFAACADVSMITGSWKSPAYQSKSFESILVAALTNHAVQKATVENDVAAELNRYSVRAYKSIEEFPPDVSNSDSDRVTIMRKVQGMNIEAILTISLLKRETESRYVDRRMVYDPFAVYPYYGSFWGYYSYWYPYSYSPGYYDEKVYYIETNLYDVRTENLVWSAQSKTYDLGDLSAFSQEFAKTIVTKLKDDGLLKGEPKKVSSNY